MFAQYKYSHPDQGIGRSRERCVSDVRLQGDQLVERKPLRTPCAYPGSPWVRHTPCRAERTFPPAVLDPACMEAQRGSS